MMTATSTPIASILSVNPVSKTVGAMHPELTDTLRRGSEVLARRTRGLLPMLSAFFATDASVKTSALLLATRTLFGAMFIVMGLSTSSLLPVETTFAAPLWASPLEICAGVALILGLFSRLSMLVLTVLYGMLTWEAASAGMFPQTALFCTLGALLNCIAGPGRFSIDMLLHNMLRRNGGAHKARKSPLSRPLRSYAA